MKRQYGRIQGLVLSLFSAPFYRDVALRWGGIGLLYVLLLLTLTWIAVLAKWQVSAGDWVRNELPTVIKDLPEISFKGGKASSDVEQPFIFNDPKTGKTIFVFDTTGKINTLAEAKADVLITETKLMINNNGQIQIHDFKEFPDFDLTRDKIKGWFATGVQYLGVGLFPIVMIGSLIRALIIMLIAGGLGMAFKGANAADLTFGTLMRLAAVGMTLPTYIDTGLTIAGIIVPYWFWIAVALTTAYAVFGAKAAAGGATPSRDENFVPPYSQDSPPPLPNERVDPDAFRERR